MGQCLECHQQIRHRQQLESEWAEQGNLEPRRVSSSSRVAVVGWWVGRACWVLYARDGTVMRTKGFWFLNMALQGAEF